MPKICCIPTFGQQQLARLGHASLQLGRPHRSWTRRTKLKDRSAHQLVTEATALVLTGSIGCAATHTLVHRTWILVLCFGLPTSTAFRVLASLPSIPYTASGDLRDCITDGPASECRLNVRRLPMPGRRCISLLA
jgi:hypothetical protein